MDSGISGISVTMAATPARAPLRAPRGPGCDLTGFRDLPAPVEREPRQRVFSSSWPHSTGTGPLGTHRMR
ncbi:hypothetical protein ABT224_40610 [Streptomyces sp. NPDC001584]|uniref:hypothetical protein n=1 Tax=Streptomyces sp. NPDC001584 TaxID=3154521 RepID=UPI00332BDDE1